MKNYIQPAQFYETGHNVDANDPKTNYKYYYPELDIDGTVEELFQEVLHNYVTNEDSLIAIQEILLQNHWDTEAEIVGFYIDELRELAENDNAYSWNRVKIDLAQGYTKGDEFSDKPWGDYSLTCWLDRDAVVLELWNYDVYPSHGATSIPFDEFMNMSVDSLEDIVGQIAAYGMQPVEE